MDFCKCSVLVVGKVNTWNSVLKKFQTFFYLNSSPKLFGKLDSTTSGAALASSDLVPDFLPVILIRFAGTKPDRSPSTDARIQPLEEELIPTCFLAITITFKVAVTLSLFY